MFDKKEEIIMKNNRKKSQTYTYKQESLDRVIIRSLGKGGIARWFFSNIFQLMPIWIMLLIQYVSEYNFKLEAYISNLLAFSLLTSGINISDFLEENDSALNRIFTICAIFVLVGVLCFSSILYCLVLLYDLANLKISANLLLQFSIYFIFIVLVIGSWQVARRER